MIRLARPLLLALSCTALLGSCSDDSAAAVEAGPEDAVATLLFVQNTEGFDYDSASGKLKLRGVSPLVTFFSDRPQRIAGHVRVGGFMDMWDEGNDSFQEDPPNACLSIVEDGQFGDAIVELAAPNLEGDTLTYEIKVLSGEVPATGGVSSLFIDGLFGRGPLLTGGARGAALGAVGGAIAGDAGKGAAIGAAVGVGTTALRNRRGRAAAAKAAATRVIDVPNANGSFTPVTLNQVENGWKGPKGEIYPTVPTPDQLKELYGVK